VRTPPPCSAKSATGTARAWHGATSGTPYGRRAGFDEAITACQEAAAIFRETGDRHRESIALANLRKAQAARPE
jgi:hypothetical protein